jgi:hypothetical protein
MATVGTLNFISPTLTFKKCVEASQVIRSLKLRKDENKKYSLIHGTKTLCCSKVDFLFLLPVPSIFTYFLLQDLKEMELP